MSDIDKLCEKTSALLDGIENTDNKEWARRRSELLFVVIPLRDAAEKLAAEVRRLKAIITDCAGYTFVPRHEMERLQAELTEAKRQWSLYAELCNQNLESK